MQQLNNGQLKEELVIEHNQFILVIIPSEKTVHCLVVNAVEETPRIVENYWDLNGYAWCHCYILNAQGKQVAYFAHTKLAYPGDRNYKTWQSAHCWVARFLDLVSGNRVCSPTDLLILGSRGYSEYEGRIECVRDVPTMSLLCGDFDEAVAFSKTYIARHMIGLTEWAGGYVFERTNGKCAAYISYSGKILTPQHPDWTDPHLVDSPLQPLYLLMHQNQVV
jgi:hypothetical protein